MINRKYGVVYTPESLAEFTAQLIADAAKEHGKTIKTVLDPACGECALLSSAKVRFGENVEYWGIDVDADAVQNAQEGFCIIHNDSIMPQKVKRSTSEYWKSKLPPIDAIIANPPWSTEKIYDRTALSNAGFSLVNLKLFGYRWEGDERVIEPDEAEIVRFIFSEYLDGKTFKAIAEELDARGVKSVNGKDKFHPMSVRRIIGNRRTPAGTDRSQRPGGDEPGGIQGQVR